MQKKEKKPIDLKNYIKQIERAIGKKDQIKEVLSNEEAFKKYLISLGMNPKWVELPAVMEVIKASFAAGLRGKQKHFKVRQSKLVMGREDSTDNSKIRPNTITMNEFELGDEEKFRFFPETGMIIYIKIKGNSNFEKREIDPETGVVMYQVKKFGGNAIDETKEEYYSLIEYRRDPEQPKVYYRTVYNNASIENNGTQEVQSEEYDYGYPVDLEKNYSTHSKTPIYFMKRYPRYEEWFQGRFQSKDEYVQKVFAMQKDIINHLWKDQRKSLENAIIAYAKTKDKLDICYRGIQNISQMTVVGPAFKLFMKTQIALIINNDSLEILTDDDSKAEMLRDIEFRLSQEAYEVSFEDVIRQEGTKTITRIKENPDYKAVKETFGERHVRFVTKGNYSMEEALSEIHDHSNFVESIQESGDTPLSQEISRLEQEIIFMNKQLQILRAVLRTFPRSQKRINALIQESEKQVVSEPILSQDPLLVAEDGR